MRLHTKAITLLELIVVLAIFAVVLAAMAALLLWPIRFAAIQEAAALQHLDLANAQRIVKDRVNNCELIDLIDPDPAAIRRFKFT